MRTNVKFVNHILRINLTTGEVKREEFSPEDARKFIGGAGTALKLLYDEVPPSVDPLSPENKLYFTAGPLDGTKIHGSGIVNVSGKSPLTGFLISAQANGFFGARMRFCGIETLVIEGAAPEWSYVFIDDGKVEIRSAAHLVGKGTWETEKLLKEEVDRPRASTACIGPAGENQVRFACTMFDRGHAASTNGSGCVMGSKKLKGIVLHASYSAVDIYDPILNTEIRKQMLAEGEASHIGKVTKAGGTHATWPMNYQLEVIPIKNASTAVSPIIEQFYWENRDKVYDRKPDPCWACPWGHCSDVTIKTGKNKGYVGEEPEYETMAGFSVNIGNEDIGETVRLLHINEDLGFDAKELIFTMSLLMECYEKGIVTKEDLGGLDMSWGNTESVEKLMYDIAFARGYGAKLMYGVKKTSLMIGGEAPDIAMYFGRGNAPHVISGRMVASIMHTFVFADNGSVYGGAQKNPQLGIDIQPENTPEETCKYFALGARKRLIEDSIGLCDFYQGGSMETQVKAINAATGWDMTLEELVKAGERIMNVARAYNVRNGLTPEMEGSPSKRAITAPPDSKTPNKSLFNKEALKLMYRTAGWDEETCKPLPSKLKELGLEYMMKDLWPEQAV